MGRPIIDFFAFGFAQQTGRFEEEDQNEDRENDRVAVGRVDVSDNERLQEADQHSTESGSRNVANASEHGSHEGLQTGVHSHQADRCSVAESK